MADRAVQPVGRGVCVPCVPVPTLSAGIEPRVVPAFQRGGRLLRLRLAAGAHGRRRTHAQGQEKAQDPAPVARAGLGHAVRDRHGGHHRRVPGPVGRRHPGQLGPDHRHPGLCHPQRAGRRPVGHRHRRGGPLPDR
ncbi:hypothetical protein L530_0347 [Bordetella bronchiseptica MO211]|nr:hypothetical protein L530_0347 [Bordetella bronchiseptica MO211]